jgi:hypothetical protein
MANSSDITRKAFRYLFMLALTWIGVSYIASGKLDTRDTVTLLLFIMSCFIFIDMYYPVVCYP